MLTTTTLSHFHYRRYFLNWVVIKYIFLLKPFLKNVSQFLLPPTQAWLMLCLSSCFAFEQPDSHDVIRDSLRIEYTSQLNPPLSTTVFFGCSFRALLERSRVFIQAVDSEKQLTQRWEGESCSEAKEGDRHLGSHSLTVSCDVVFNALKDGHYSKPMWDCQTLPPHRQFPEGLPEFISVGW